MQIIDPNKPFFVDPLPAPNTVAVQEKMAFTNFQNTKQYWSIQFPSNTGSPAETFNFFNYEFYRASPSTYNKLSINGGSTFSYRKLLNLVLNNAFKIWWIKISWRFGSLTDAQLNQPLLYNYKDANGIIKQDSTLGYEDLDPYQKNFNVINLDLRDSNVILDQDRWLEYRFIQSVGLQGATFCFYYEQALQSDVLDEDKELDRLLNF